MKRLFVATPKITLSGDTQRVFENLKFKLQNENIVWVKDEVRHLTLRFIGPTPPQNVALIKNLIDEACEKYPAFSLKIDKIGIFGSRYDPKVIWLGFNDFQKFKELYVKLEQKLTGQGFEANHGNFVPHITLGRIKKLSSKDRFWKIFEASSTQPLFQELRVSRINLYQSFLNKEGPEYRTLYSKQLQEEW